MAAKLSDFHMEWTDVRNTSSNPIFDSGGASSWILEEALQVDV